MLDHWYGHEERIQIAPTKIRGQTAALGLFNGLNIRIPDLDNLPGDKSHDKDETKETAAETKPEAESPLEPKEDWVIVLGGASSVGKYGIQVSHCYQW